MSLVAERASVCEVMDCATKLRIHYGTCRGIEREFFELFPHARAVVNEFSRHVKGAQDHFTLSDGELFHVSGILGQPILAVTFWNPSSAGRQRDVSRFEELLATGGYGQAHRE